ncbi:MAG: DUF401 family protein [Desulfobacteraceae bacterium]
MDSIPAVVRILMIFGLILLAIKANWSLGNTFLMGAAGMGIIFNMAPFAIVKAAVVALLDPKTLSLSVVVSLILVLSHSLEQSGQMERVLKRFKGVIPWPKVNIVIFPALIGLLPMPGGAIFSAPMVKAIGASQRLSASQLSYINYWFRHIWEYWWPLYPGVLLTTTLAGVDLWHLVFYTSPLTLVAVLMGYWPLGGNLKSRNTAYSPKAFKPFFIEALPILIAIFCGLGFGQLFSTFLPTATKWHSIDKELGLILALIISIGWVCVQNKMSYQRLGAIIFKPAVLNMIYMVSAILVFKGILEKSGAINLISTEMLQWRIPLAPITMILPFLVGMVAGITIAFVGATFPILISLIHTLDQATLLLPYLMLALASGFCGVLLSPLHLCLLLSNQYFKTTLLPVYRHMRVPICALLFSSILYFLIINIIIK